MGSVVGTLFPMLTALCLDLMDTILADPYAAALRAGTGLELGEIAALRDPGAWPRFEVAELDEQAFAAGFFAAHAREDHRFDLDAFHRVRRAGTAFLPGMEAVLDDTRGRIERYVASNYPVWIVELVERFGLDERVDGVWASHHLGVRKPAAAFYERLLERIGHTAQTCLFVDDRAVNCTAAEAAGMRAHLFTGAADLRARLVTERVLEA
jgi:HAD superfamily hydrolase (TIGR01509 family)